MKNYWFAAPPTSAFLLGMIDWEIGDWRLEIGVESLTLFCGDKESVIWN